MAIKYNIVGNSFIEAIQPTIDSLTCINNRVEIMEAQINELYRMIEGLKSASAPNASPNAVEPKVKSDLEIFEVNIDDEVDPYITPQYYLDDDEKNDYWY